MRQFKFTSMYIGILFAGILSACGTSKNSSANNMVARMQINEPIKGLCDSKNVIVVLPFPGNGQVKAQAPKSEEEITEELNAKVVFLKDKPTYEDKGMLGLIINCKGQLVKCEMDNKTKNADLDRQIVAVFANLKQWKAGKINNTPVDTAELFSFTIKNGKITIS
jgi:hypothetical protein